MEYDREGNVFVAKLDHDTDLFTDLQDIFEGFNCGLIVSGIGMLKDFKLGFYDSDTGTYEWEEFSEGMELLTLNGSITADETIHLHAVVSGKDHIARGGHLEGGRVHNVVELTGLLFETITLRRLMDELSGSELLTIE